MATQPTKIETDETTITLLELERALTPLLSSDVRKAVALWGPTGVGKSSILAQITALAGTGDRNAKPTYSPNAPSCAVYGNWGLIDERLTLKDAADLRGVPFPKDGLLTWLVPEELPVIGQEARFPSKGILLLDEINLADPSIQNASYSLVLDRRIGSHRLMPGWHVVAAGNLKSEKAYTFDLAHPLKNRLIHFYIRPDLEVFRNWALKGGVDPRIVYFLNLYPDHLHLDVSESGDAFPTPRAWSTISDILPLYSDGEEQKTLIFGTVGPATGLLFRGFLDTIEAQTKGPYADLKKVVMDPTSVPTLSLNEPSTAWALATRLCSAFKRREFEPKDIILCLCSPLWATTREVGRFTLADMKLIDPQMITKAFQDSRVTKAIIASYADFILS